MHRIAPFHFLLILACSVRAGARVGGHAGPNYCGVDIPEDEALGVVGLPQGDVFCPLLADPKNSQSFASWERVSTKSSFGTDIGSVGVADRFRTLVALGVAPRQATASCRSVSKAASTLSSTWRVPSYDLINADYVFGVPITARIGSFSARVRAYHQSSHLGDEFLLRADHPERENLSFQSVEAILSFDVSFVRVYGGGEYLFNQQPERVEHAHRPRRHRAPPAQSALRVGWGIHLIAAGDVKALEREDWKAGYSVRAGLEMSRSGEHLHVARRWMLLASTTGELLPTASSSATTSSTPEWGSTSPRRGLRGARGQQGG